MTKTQDDPRLAKIFALKWTRKVIEEAVGNWTQNHEVMDPTMIASLNDYAARVATKIFDAELPYPDFSPDWKKNVSNKVEEALDLKQFVTNQIPIIVEELRIKHGDRSEEFEGLWGYSLMKIASYIGNAAFMVANNLDPQLLIMTREEGQKYMLQMAERLSKSAPDKVLEFDLSVDTVQDVVDEITLRTNPPDVSEVFNKK